MGTQDIYINGIQVVKTGYEWKYNVLLELSDEVKATLTKGKNIIAAHCHNRTGGGYVDFGLFEKEPDKSIFTKTATQKSASVLPTQTVYTFECGPVDLNLFLRPINYITYQVKSRDNALHDVQIYFETTSQWAVNSDSQPVNFEKIEKDGLTYLKTGTKEQPVLQKKGDDVRIDWGYFYMTGKSDKSSAMNFGDYWTPKKEFMESGKISTRQPSSLSEQMNKSVTVLVYCKDLG